MVASKRSSHSMQTRSAARTLAQLPESHGECVSVAARVPISLTPPRDGTVASFLANARRDVVFGEFDGLVGRVLRAHHSPRLKALEVDAEEIGTESRQDE